MVVVCCGFFLVVFLYVLIVMMLLDMEICICGQFFFDLGFFKVCNLCVLVVYYVLYYLYYIILIGGVFFIVVFNLMVGEFIEFCFCLLGLYSLCGWS